MQFILQKESEFEDGDIFNLRVLLKGQKFQHSFTTEGIDFFEGAAKESEKLKEAIPVGSLDFVGTYLKYVYGIDNMNPIEVPKVLCREDFLRRMYSIIPLKELLTKKGFFFTKYASALKYFSHTGLVEQLSAGYGEYNNFLKEGYYVFSEVVDIMAEYRVFVLNDEIKAIQFYDGDPLVMPSSEELKQLQKMVMMYQMDNTRPMAYSLDVAILRENTAKGRGLAILECHPFACLGLYGFYSSSLPYCYRNGLDWYIKHNTPVVPLKII